MLHFQMSTVDGEVLDFAFDQRHEILAADEIDAIAEAAQLEDDDSIDVAFDLLAEAMKSGRLTRSGLRVLVAIAWVAHRRAGADVTPAAFARVMAPTTLRWASAETAPVGDGGPRQPSATRKRAKPRKKP